MFFKEYANQRVMTLSRQGGEPFNCFYDPTGLPEKLIHFPTLFSDAPAEPRITMRLVAFNGGNNLAAYLADEIGLKSGVDFVRHGNNERSGLLYFDIITTEAVEKLFARADQIGQGSTAERSIPSPQDRRR